MLGRFKKGSGLAHNCCRPHREVFNCNVYGTFNIEVPDLNILAYVPSIINPRNNKQYWFVVIRDLDSDREYLGWAIRDKTSKQKRNTLEVLTKELLPEYLKECDLDVTLPYKWSTKTIRKWALDKYWFQTFTFSPKKRADSALVWKTIDIINWEKKRVLDWGCHYGYMSFEASKKGAIVTGIDKNIDSLKMAKTIRNHIVQQDVVFATHFNLKESYDVVLYLSVHHQRDSRYINLRKTIEALRQATQEHLFIELIMPPVYPKRNHMSEMHIDEIVGGDVLLKYKHRVRGIRKIYHIEL